MKKDYLSQILKLLSGGEKMFRSDIVGRLNDGHCTGRKASQISNTLDALVRDRKVVSEIGTKEIGGRSHAVNVFYLP